MTRVYLKSNPKSKHYRRREAKGYNRVGKEENSNDDKATARSQEKFIFPSPNPKPYQYPIETMQMRPACMC